MDFEIFDLDAFPLYDDDITASSGEPEIVKLLKQHIADAHGLLIACPEYNYSVSGVLKNAIDWVSRPPRETPFQKKPVAVMGAGGVMGTSRAQYHLRQVLVSRDMYIMSKPELTIPRSWEHFDENGNLTDEETWKRLEGFLDHLVKWIHYFQ